MGVPSASGRLHEVGLACKHQVNAAVADAYCKKDVPADADGEVADTDSQRIQNRQIRTPLARINVFPSVKHFH
jgi:hypothetical protein